MDVDRKTIEFKKSNCEHSNMESLTSLQKLNQFSVLPLTFKVSYANEWKFLTEFAPKNVHGIIINLPFMVRSQGAKLYIFFFVFAVSFCFMKTFHNKLEGLDVGRL